jgi:hypothetical protein
MSYCNCSFRGPRFSGCQAAGPLPSSWHQAFKAPQLATIAKWINECTTLWATTYPTVYNTDTKIAGTRLRRPGKGRRGTILIVSTSEKEGRASLSNRNYFEGLVLRHNSAETYRHNGEVVNKLHDYLTKHPEVMKS